MSNVGIKMKKFVVSQYKAWASLFALWSIQVRSVQQRVTLSVGTSLTAGRFPLSKACSLWVIWNRDQISCSVLCSCWSSLRISIWCQCVTKQNLLYIRSRQSSVSQVLFSPPPWELPSPSWSPSVSPPSPPAPSTRWRWMCPGWLLR